MADEGMQATQETQTADKTPGTLSSPASEQELLLLWSDTAVRDKFWESH